VFYFFNTGCLIIAGEIEQFASPAFSRAEHAG
jgi:hypothetical protein